MAIRSVKSQRAAHSRGLDSPTRLGHPVIRASAAERTALTAKIRAVAATPQGIYALMDYVNFKGEGIRAGERYNGQGWGLLQVLQEMQDAASGIPARQEFSRAAISVLKRRIANSPPARGEQRWMEGWQNRCLTYR